jgi:hypothetical protein
MKLPSPKVIAINLVCLFVLAFAVNTQIRAYFFPPQIDACPTRYAKAVRFGVERAGVILTASDVQAVSSGADAGVMENLAVERFKDAPAPTGFVVAIEAGSAQQNRDKVKGGGISFPWSPRTLAQGAAAACLSYHVFLPADFDFGGGGTLPGLFGAGAPSTTTSEERFDTRVLWLAGGVPQMHQLLTGKDASFTEATTTDALGGLERGRWLRIDQEVVLNTPGTPDGRIRLWVDGVLRGEARNAEPRTQADTVVLGVMVDAYFGSQPHAGIGGEGHATKNETIKLTPFEVRWN